MFHPSVIEDFLTKDECLAVKKRMDQDYDKFYPSKILENDIDAIHKERNSMQYFYKPEDFPTVTSKIQNLSQFGSFEVLALKYQGDFKNPGVFKSHFDTTFYEKSNNNNALRFRSFIIYLNDFCNYGGALEFPRINKIIYPEQGTLVFFNTCDEHLRPIPESQHRSLPLYQHEKYVLIYFNSVLKNIHPHKTNKQMALEFLKHYHS